MIFVTVGTHEQQFNRLIKQIDELVSSNVINEEVIIQRGYSTYKPLNCKYYDLIPWEKMQELYQKARIIITHGGPASFIDAIAIGKNPIIVPRQSDFGEHVNNHQLNFCRELINKSYDLIVVEDIKKLKDEILNFDCKHMLEKKPNKELFNKRLNKMIEELFE